MNWRETHLGGKTPGQETGAVFQKRDSNELFQSKVGELKKKELIHEILNEIKLTSAGLSQGVVKV